MQLVKDVSAQAGINADENIDALSDDHTFRPVFPSKVGLSKFGFVVLLLSPLPLAFSVLLGCTQITRRTHQELL